MINGDSLTHEKDWPVCIWHKGCVDGFTAAWIVWRTFNGHVELFEGVYNEPPPEVHDRKVIMVDFSYSAKIIEQMENEAQAVLILDHHKTAEAALKPWIRPMPWPLPTSSCVAHFDMNRSGAGLTWDYFTGGLPRPRLVNFVEDRDLWQFNLMGTREVGACLYSHPFDLMTWESLMIELESEQGLSNIIAQGSAIDRAHTKNYKALVNETMRYMKIGGKLVPVCNAPFFMASDIGNFLSAVPNNPTGYSATYYDREDGSRVFSLRSKGDVDVSAIAKSYGGGGHKNAAGFKAPNPNWEGE